MQDCSEIIPRAFSRLAFSAFNTHVASTLSTRPLESYDDVQRYTIPPNPRIEVKIYIASQCASARRNCCTQYQMTDTASNLLPSRAVTAFTLTVSWYQCPTQISERLCPSALFHPTQPSTISHARGPAQCFHPHVTRQPGIMHDGPRSERTTRRDSPQETGPSGHSEATLHTDIEIQTCSPGWLFVPSTGGCKRVNTLTVSTVRGVSIAGDASINTWPVHPIES